MEVGLYTTTPEVESSKTDGDKKKDKDKTDKKEENATSEEGQDTTTSTEQHSEEETNSEKFRYSSRRKTKCWSRNNSSDFPCSRLILNNKKRKMLTFYVFYGTIVSE